MTVLTPFMFGAMGDGVTDDQLALEAMLASLEAGREANIVGAFVHSGLLGVAGKSGFRISGPGTIKMQDGAAVAEAYGGIRFIGCSDFVLEDFTVDGNRETRSPANGAGHLVNFRSCHDFDVIRVKAINSCTDGFYMASSTPSDTATHSYGFRFIDCEADNCYRNGMALIQGRDGHVIRGRYLNTNGMAPGAGIDLESNPGDPDQSLSNITLTDVTCSDNEASGIQVSPVRKPADIKIIRPRLERNGKSSVLLGTPCAAMIWGATSGLVEDAVIDGADDNTVRGVIDVLAGATNGDVDIVRPRFRNMSFGAGKTLVYVHSGSAGKVRVRGLVADAAHSVAVFGAPDCSIEDSRVASIAGDAGILVNSGGTRARVKGNRINSFYGAAIQLLANDGEVLDNTLEEPTLNTSGACLRVQGPGARVERNTIRRSTSASGHGIRIDAAYRSLQDNVIDGFTGNPIYLTGNAATEAVGFKKRNVSNGARAAEN